MKSQKLRLFFLPLLAIPLLMNCANNEKCTIHPIVFNDATEIPLEEFDDFYASRDIRPGEHYNGRRDYGYVKDKYHTLKINGQKIETYTALCESNLHSFAYVDVENLESSRLDVELELLTKDKKSVVVLPEKSGVIPTFNPNTGIVKATITKYGDYSFAFDEEPDKGFTLFVAPYTPLVVPDGYKTQTIQPGTYFGEELAFKDTHTVYYFKAGHYKLTKIVLPSNSVIYFEPGFTAMVYDDDPAIGDRKDDPLIYFNGENGKICGHGLIDFSQCMGGDEKIKNPMSFDYSHKGGINISGLITINSHTWTLCFTDCDNVYVDHCLLLGYRMYSDGIMLSNCRDSLVEHNFVHTGDDAIEAKSTNDVGEGADNLLYRYNTVWTDKANAYGCIYESVKDIKNVHFVDNSVGFAMGEWSDHLGSCEISMGSAPSTFSDIHFNNMEIYYSNNPAICNINIRDYAGHKSAGTIDDIHFNNITAKFNTKKIVSVFTSEDVADSEIGNLYFSNVKSIDHRLEQDDYDNAELVRIDVHTSTGFPKERFHVNNTR
ncbi:MAG: glycosyl hydrolase family 28 protein [Bacilli bacterium]|nr:glycosyl hydrolase family 28 protein [Bacilli bacterium]